MTQDKTKSGASMVQRIGEMLAQLPPEERESTVLHLMGVISGVTIAAEARKMQAPKEAQEPARDAG